MKPTSILFFAGAIIAAIPAVRGMPANPLRNFKETQPDGTVITLRLNGGTHDSWMIDEDQYTVVKDPTTGFFVYARPDGEGGLEPSSEAILGYTTPESNRDEHTMDKTRYQEEQHQNMPPHSPADPSSTAVGLGLELSSNHASSSNLKKQKNLRPTKRDCRSKICAEHLNHKNDMDRRKSFLRRRKLVLDEQNPTSSGSITSDRRIAAGEKQRLRNLVLLLQWSDHSDRELPTREEYDILMNHDGPHPLCPTGSVRDVFLQNSYGTLEVNSYVTDWIPMNGTEEYYANGDKGLDTYIHDALRYALEYADNITGVHEVDFDFFDEDRDGLIDAITFIHSGYPAEAGGTDYYGRFYKERIWSHKYALIDQNFQSKKGRNVRVHSYHISSGLWGLKGSRIGRIGVIAHEMAHFLGLPDLYDYDGSSNGVGNYGLMANSWGIDGKQLRPPHMTPLAKIVLGWISPVKPSPGVNIVEASAEQDPSHPQFYIIEEGFPDGEFLLIENRQPLGYDELLPQGGLAIWHIDYGSTGTYNGIDIFYRQSIEGHPDQEGWPENGNHYAVALLQADGYYDLETGFNSGDYLDLFHADNVDELVPCRHNINCQYPNTDSYRDGIIARSNVHITDISASGNIMTFNYMVGELPQTNPPTSVPTFSPTPFPTSTPTISPTTEKDRTGRRAGRICRNDKQCTSDFCKKRWRWFFGMGWSFFGRCTLVEDDQYGADASW